MSCHYACIYHMCMTGLPDSLPSGSVPDCAVWPSRHTLHGKELSCCWNHDLDPKENCGNDAGDTTIANLRHRFMIYWLSKKKQETSHTVNRCNDLCSNTSLIRWLIECCNFHLSSFIVWFHSWCCGRPQPGNISLLRFAGLQPTQWSLLWRKGCDKACGECHMLWQRSVCDG